MTKKDHFIASLLGGAIGDALGYAVEFDTLNKIKSAYGAAGITDLEIDRQSGKALVSDDTQMTLFTADGILWAYDRMSSRGIGTYAGSGVYQSYLRWYHTQGGGLKHNEWVLEKQPHEEDFKINILDHKELYSLRAPGNTCLSALGSGKMGTIENPINNSKGCGGVMRVAPVGLFLHHDPEQAFRIGAEVAAITHGHPEGYLASGALAAIIAELLNGKSIIESAETAKDFLDQSETLRLINRAIELSAGSESVETAIPKLGEGWIAEEALAIGLYSALKEPDFQKALIASVNHNGDSDSTGAICGNILGARFGMGILPNEWVDKVELKNLTVDLGTRLYETWERAFKRI